MIPIFLISLAICGILYFVTGNAGFIFAAIFIGAIGPFFLDVPSDGGTDCYVSWDGVTNRTVCD